MSSPTVKSNIVNIPKMTVLLASRGRQKKLTDVIQSLIITSKDKSDIQFLIAVDRYEVVMPKLVPNSRRLFSL